MVGGDSEPAFTVRVVWSLMLPCVAEMVVVPAAIAVAKPDEMIVATFWSLLAQVT